AAVAEATLLAEDPPEAPDVPTPFATESAEPASNGIYEPAAGEVGGDQSDDGGLAALRELAAVGFTEPEPDEAVRLPDQAKRPASVPGGSYEPASESSGLGGNPFVDSAALLRELSSLGLDDSPAASPVRAPVQRTPVATQARPKRKSIFGR
ncbi:MAG TPA: hypothetical protein VIJ71_02050, partial [Mycobacteriales bacterium]